MDGHEHHIVVLIDELDDLLHLVAVGDAYQSAKASNAMINVNNIVAQLKLLYFLQRERHTSAVGFLALEVVLVEAVKYLMVGEETGLQVIVHITGMKSALHGGESDSCLLVLENLTQAFGLLLAVGKNVEVITICFQLSECGAQEVEILVEQGLEFYVETHNGAWRRAGLVAKFKTLATR